MAAVRTVYVTVASREGVLLSVNSGDKKCVLECDYFETALCGSQQHICHDL